MMQKEPELTFPHGYIVYRYIWNNFLFEKPRLAELRIRKKRRKPHLSEQERLSGWDTIPL